MIDKIILSTYGRTVADENWYTDFSTGVCRMYDVNAGEFKYVIDEKEVMFEPGYIYVIPKNILFSPTGAKCFDHSYIDFFSIPGFICNEIIKIDKKKDNKLIADAARICFDIANAYPESEGYSKYRVYLEKYVCNFVNLLIEEYEQCNIITDNMEKALDYIYKNFNKNITVKELADICLMSESKFYALFKKKNGYSPHRYIRICRLSEATKLLKEGYPIKYIASEVGFESASSFSKAYKQDFKVSPKNVMNNTENNLENGESN